MDMAVKAVASSFKDSEKVESDLALKVKSLHSAKAALEEENSKKENKG